MYKKCKQLVEFFAVCLTKVSHNVIVVQIPIRKITKLSMNYLFGKCKPIFSFLWIFSRSLDKFLIENSIFCAV